MLVRRVAEFIEEHRLTVPGQTVLVAVSGGPDSVALLYILFELREGLGIRLHVAHLDHMLRGEEALQDAAYVRQLAEGLGVPATFGRRDVQAHRRERHLSVEDAARQVRYAFLAEVAANVGAQRLAVGHTLNDQVETVLLHLIRGSGLAGISGMQPLGKVQIDNDLVLEVVRPLLSTTRQEVMTFCRSRGLVPREDPSNRFPQFLRNRIRLELMPLLEQFNPNIQRAIAGLAETAADDIAFIEGEEAKHWEKVATTVNGSVALDTAGVRALPMAIRRRVLRHAIQHLRHSLRDIALVHVEDMVSALDKGAGTTVDLPGSLRFTVGYEESWLYRVGAKTCPLAPLEGVHALSVPGETRLDGWEVRARLRDVREGEVWSKQGLVADFDFDRIGSDLVVRPRLPGDRFVPLGMQQSKKLQDFMVDVKIPRDWRSRVPIVASHIGPVWVVGWRIDERAKVTSDTRRVLRLEFIPLPARRIQDP